MKNALLFILLIAATATQAQKFTRLDVLGEYEVSKFYLNDTLFYDKANSEKSDKNILIEIGKQVPMYTTRNDSTIAIALFYKDIYKALQTRFYFSNEGTVKSKCGDKSNSYLRLNYTDQWEFDEKKQVVKIIHKGKVTERMPVKKVNGVVTLFIDDKKEKTRLELVKVY